MFEDIGWQVAPFGVQSHGVIEANDVVSNVAGGLGVLTAAGFATTNAADLNGVSYHLAFEIDYAAQAMRVSLNNTAALFTGADFLTANSAGGVGGAPGVISWGERVSYDNVVVTDLSVSSVPEPGTLALLLPGLACLWVSRRRK